MKNAIRFFHVKKLDHKMNRVGVATIASMVVGSGKTATVRVGVSFCSPEDQFVKKFGRANALERMSKLETSYVDKFTGHSSDTIINIWDKIEKPRFWKDTALQNITDIGLVVVHMN